MMALQMPCGFVIGWHLGSEWEREKLREGEGGREKAEGSGIGQEQE